MEPYWEIDGVQVWHGDCIQVMSEMEANSVHAVVCDPPYGLEFMGKNWDAPWKDIHGNALRSEEDARTTKLGLERGGADPYIGSGIRFGAGRPFQEWCQLWATEALRVLKPGAHLLAFGGTRTYHRLACAIEDAGFEVRDSIHWVYGSGFPKSHSVALGIDKMLGGENRGRAIPTASTYQASDTEEKNKLTSNPVEEYEATNPEAEVWLGWGTALKPAHEPVVVARKPLVGTVAANVIEYGTGGLNIDGCRIGTSGGTESVGEPNHLNEVYGHGMGGLSAVEANKGRWPANIILSHSEGCVEVGERQVKSNSQSKDRPGTNSPIYRPGQEHEMVGAGHGVDGVETIPTYRCVDGCPVAELDRQSGLVPGAHPQKRFSSTRSIFGAGGGFDVPYEDTGGASRFFYVPKASAADRTDGLDKSWFDDGERNIHPTVKPVELMRYLVRLVTPPEGTVLDPFLGSGSTGIAAIREGFNFIGIEKSDEYVELATKRIRSAHTYLAEPQALF